MCEELNKTSALCLCLGVIVQIVVFSLNMFVFSMLQDLRDFYTPGNKIEYSCIDGYHLLGDPMAECTEDGTWSMLTMECKRTLKSHQLQKMIRV